MGIEKPVEEKKFTLTYTEDEIQREISNLQSDEDIEMFLKVQTGAEKFKKLLDLQKVITKKWKVKRMKRMNNDFWFVLLCCSPFFILTFVSYLAPILIELTMRTSLLFYIFGTLQEIIVIMIFTLYFILKFKGNESRNTV